MSDDSGLIAITNEDEMPKSAFKPPQQDSQAPQSSTAPRATPTIPTGGLFSPYATIQINASPQAVYEAIVATSLWKEWNTFVPNVITSPPPNALTNSGRMTKNSSMTFKVQMTKSVNTTSKEVVNVLDPPPETAPSRPGYITRICWTLDNKAILTPRFLVHAERVNEIEDRGDGTCIYRTWETFSGLAARIIKWRHEAALKARFQDWVQDLKKYVEKKESLKMQRSAAIEMEA